MISTGDKPNYSLFRRKVCQTSSSTLRHTMPIVLHPPAIYFAILPGAKGWRGLLASKGAARRESCSSEGEVDGCYMVSRRSFSTFFRMRWRLIWER
jgi:hypothetical protein